MQALIQKIVHMASDHPLLAVWLCIFLSSTLLLGFLHESRILGDCLIVLVRHAKYELAACADMFRRLKNELSSWRATEVGRDHEHQPKP